MIKIDQMLHGYSDGHRLLESSARLSNKDERILLLMSDMSGPSMIQGFESYITGYPLVDSDYYALAKTWYAPEMKRPGCVWTHTLLISRTDFDQIKNLASLLNLFVCPSNQQSDGHYDLHKFYGSQLELNPTRDDIYDFCLGDVSVTLVMQVVQSLYQEPQKSIFIVSESARQYESMIISIWNQQWAKLQSRFSFCTGAIADRKVSDRSFDMQVVAYSYLRQAKREAPSAVIIDPENLVESTIVPSCLAKATDDLLQTNASKLSRFLSLYGEGGRENFFSFVKIYHSVDNVERGVMELSNLTKEISELFPSPHDAKPLKGAVFGKKSKLLHNYNEMSLLQELTTTKYYSSLDVQSLEVRNRAEAFWGKHSDRQDFFLNLLSVELNPIGDELLAGIAITLSPVEALQLSNRKPALLYALVRANPALASSPELWQQANEYELFDSVKISQQRTTDTPKAIIQAMLEAGVDSIAEDVVGTFKDDAIEVLLEWLISGSENSYVNLGNNWKNALRANPSTLIDWLNRSNQTNVNTLALIANLLDPNAPAVLRVGAESWLRLAKKIGNNLSDQKLYEIMAFFLVIGFNNAGKGSDELTALSFEIVHDAVSDNKLEYNSWRLLEKHVPELWSWMNWDRCERLRRALVDKFLLYDWSAEQFLLSTINMNTFSKTIAFMNNTPEGKEYIANIARQVISGGIHATEQQREILDRCRGES